LNTTLKLLLLNSGYFVEYNTEASCTKQQVFAWIQHRNLLY